MNKPQTSKGSPRELQAPKGFRDFLPSQMRGRQFVAQKVKEVFERFGFEPLETPTIEYASVLLGKYGKEADKLVFQFKDKGDRQIALRYDQTVPTARILSQYRNEIPRFFRRYQIQNVFRAEKPQQGRYREFTQCDIDIFNSPSPIADAEIVACTYFAFKNVGYPTIQIKINDRNILFEALEEFVEDDVPLLSIIQTIDKLDRVGKEGVLDELEKKGLSKERAGQALTKIQETQPTENLRTIMAYCFSLGVPENVLTFDPSIARGLDYYTGMIFEVFLPEFPGKSLGGGGRYDNLVKQLGGSDTPAVGIAFGFDRMVEAAEKLQLVPQKSANTKVLITLFDELSIPNSLQTAALLRNSEITVEVFPSLEKLDKQLKYADRKGIPFVLIQGPEELKNNSIQLKNMRERTSKVVSIDKLITEVAGST